MPDETTTSPPRLGIGSLVSHPDFGRGRVVRYQDDGYLITFRNGESHWLGRNAQALKSLEMAGDPQIDHLKQAVREVLHDYGWLDAEMEMGRRWMGGTVRLIPGQEGTQPKDIPIEAFFKKVIGVREKLRVLEQKINNHPTLSAEEKLDLAAYVTRCYGSLTTFNVLFATRASQFTSAGGAPEETD
jgi:hypothetical protein